MYFINRKPDFRIITTIIRCYSIARQSHYEVLKLRKNCTDKDIKQAFIKMSKEYHPDKNKDSKAQENFVRIVEAYNVLGKPGSRAHYDNMTMYNTSQYSSPYVYRSNDAYNYRYNTRYNQYYDNQSSSKETKRQTGYYGMRKVPNLYIVMLCFGVAFVGILLQVYVIREMYVIHQRQALERSKYLAQELEKVRVAAQNNPNEVQTRLMVERIVTAANQTVATASLGQALAGDKKKAKEPVFKEYEIPRDYCAERYYRSDEDKENMKLTVHELAKKLVTSYNRGA